MKPHLTGSPGYWRYVYAFNFEAGSYQLASRPMGSHALPVELKIERTQRGDIQQRAEHLIRSKKNEFYTGLRATDYPGYFTGDHRLKQRGGFLKKSFILFELSPDQLSLTMYYFFSWVPVNRDQFLKQIFY